MNNEKTTIKNYYRKLLPNSHSWDFVHKFLGTIIYFIIALYTYITKV